MAQQVRAAQVRAEQGSTRTVQNRRADRSPERADHPPARAGDRLRALLAGPAIVELASICDPLGARLAQDAGFEAVAVAGFSVGAHTPLSHSLSIGDVVRATAAVAAACTVPVLVDADAGWGAADQVASAVARLEVAGAGAIALSSQHLPDGVPFSDRAERRAARRELLDRVAVAAKAREQALVMASCVVVAGDDDYGPALEHIRSLLNAGADAIGVYCADKDHVRRLPADLGSAPLIYSGDPGLTCGRAVHDAQRLEQWAYRGVRSKYHQCYCPRMLDQQLGRTPADTLG